MNAGFPIPLTDTTNSGIHATSVDLIWKTVKYIYGLVQDCGDSSANTLELPVLC